MSIEDVERILDETQESTDYQRVKCLTDVYQIYLHRTIINTSTACMPKIS